MKKKPEMDATEYLLSSQANREHLLRSIQQLRDGTPLITKTMAELEAMSKTANTKQKRTERKESSNDR